MYVGVYLNTFVSLPVKEGGPSSFLAFFLGTLLFSLIKKYACVDRHLCVIICVLRMFVCVFACMLKTFVFLGEKIHFFLAFFSRNTLVFSD